MRRLIYVLIAGTGLVACNGGSDSDTASTPQATPQSASTESAKTAADTANGVRESIEALSPTTTWTTTLTARASTAKDPGPRSTTGDAGGSLDGLSTAQKYAFGVGKADFEEAEEPDEGLGPTFNLDSCGGCHAQPAVGGTSPRVNPQARMANALNKLPPFITADGPVREARFVRNANGTPDGGVHGLFTISGRAGAETCSIKQPDFAGQLSRNNVIFRIPTPLFGAGLIESIPDGEILKNQALAASTKQALGIGGRPNLLLSGGLITGSPNRNGNDGTIGRFGHKAQNKSLLIFSGEAYNVEMGITNLAFPTERDETCLDLAPLPNSEANFEPTAGSGFPAIDGLSSIEKFTVFMRFLAPPKPSNAVTGASGASINSGRQSFTDVGCALCHTPSMRTYTKASIPAMADKTVNLFSDLMLHDMGRGLADGIQQGQAGGRDFRTAPLWGLGQRLFFLHDGRTADLRRAIREHFSDGSEANAVTQRFFDLGDTQQQDLLNFLRSL
jgi:CxxC motif-containing protein (DUF1111 family)